MNIKVDDIARYSWRDIANGLGLYDSLVATRVGVSQRTVRLWVAGGTISDQALTRLMPFVRAAVSDRSVYIAALHARDPHPEAMLREWWPDRVLSVWRGAAWLQTLPRERDQSPPQ